MAKKHNHSKNDQYWENPEAPFLKLSEIKAAKTPEELKALYNRPIRTLKSNPDLVIELI